MVSAKVKVTNPMGLHMRPAQLFVREMTAFQSDVFIAHNGNEINGKSIMNMIASGIKQGSEILVKCDGPDEKEALQHAVSLIESGLGE